MTHRGQEVALRLIGLFDLAHPAEGTTDEAADEPEGEQNDGGSGGGDEEDGLLEASGGERKVAGHSVMAAKFSEKEETGRRGEILDDAASVFARKGFEGTTIRDLEEATGLSRGGIFFHFPSKEEIYKAAIRRCALGGPPFVASRARGAKTAGEALLAVFTAVGHEYSVGGGNPNSHGVLASSADRGCRPSAREAGG